MSQNELLQITFANDSITCYLISMTSTVGKQWIRLYKNT